MTKRSRKDNRKHFSVDDARRIFSFIGKMRWYHRAQSIEDQYKQYKQKIRYVYDYLKRLEKTNPEQTKRLREQLQGFVKELQEKERNVLEFAAKMEQRLQEGPVEDTSPECMNVKERIAKLYEEYRDVFDTILSIMEEIYSKCIDACEEMWRMEDKIIWGYYGEDPDTIIRKAREAADIARKVIVYGKTCHDWAAMVAALRYRYRGKKLTELTPVQKLGLIYDYYKFGLDEIAKAKLGHGKARRVSEALNKMITLMGTYMYTCDEKEVSVVICREYSIRQMWTRFKIPIF